MKDFFVPYVVILGFVSSVLFGYFYIINDNYTDFENLSNEMHEIGLPINVSKAMYDLNVLSGIKPSRNFGTSGHQKAYEYLIKRCQEIKDNAHDGWIVDIVVDHTPGVLNIPAFKYLAKAIGVDNIFLVLRPHNTVNEYTALLAHYDHCTGRSNNGYQEGAHDNGIAVCSSLNSAEMFSSLNPDQFTKGLIVIFNGPEEMGLLGSASFVTTDLWKTNITSYVNADAASTSGDRLNLARYSKNGKNFLRALEKIPIRTKGSSVNGDIMASGLLSSNDDFAVTNYASNGDKPGIDFAYSQRYQGYHTSVDNFHNVAAASMSYSLGLISYLSDFVMKSSGSLANEDNIGIFTVLGHAIVQSGVVCVVVSVIVVICMIALSCFFTGKVEKTSIEHILLVSQRGSAPKYDNELEEKPTKKRNGCLEIFFFFLVLIFSVVIPCLVFSVFKGLSSLWFAHYHVAVLLFGFITALVLIQSLILHVKWFDHSRVPLLWILLSICGMIFTIILVNLQYGAMVMTLLMVIVACVNYFLTIFANKFDYKFGIPVVLIISPLVNCMFIPMFEDVLTLVLPMLNQNGNGKSSMDIPFIILVAIIVIIGFLPSLIHFRKIIESYVKNLQKLVIKLAVFLFICVCFLSFINHRIRWHPTAVSLVSTSENPFGGFTESYPILFHAGLVLYNNDSRSNTPRSPYIEFVVEWDVSQEQLVKYMNSRGFANFVPCDTISGGAVIKKGVCAPTTANTTGLVMPQVDFILHEDSEFINVSTSIHLNSGNRVIVLFDTEMERVGCTWVDEITNNERHSGEYFHMLVGKPQMSDNLTVSFRKNTANTKIKVHAVSNLPDEKLSDEIYFFLHSLTSNLANMGYGRDISLEGWAVEYILN
eukprot:TRINITY_DN13763_c0_g1_i1.p1 TRINITY_DN13763_c0_g1~~TRINITY_DN13763_c0_g1_i1.p1  ORF type:complete len:885 (-),score=227.58 TRINITY_DN13763_c0_g1_i1:4-2625(-)